MTSEQGTEFPEASLTQHLFDLAQQVTIALGETENPITKNRDANLPAARYLIDIITLLEEKTRGQRTEEEETYFSQLLPALKIGYVNKSK
jgi:hypothetical protein